MRALAPVWATSLVLLSPACSDVGLDQFNGDTGLETGGVLEIEPIGDIWFGALTPEDPTAYQELVLKSVGDEKIAIIDVYLDEKTSQAFQMASDDLPLPLQLDPGKEFPVKVAFSPYAVGEFTGTFIAETDGGGDLVQQTRDLRGRGCPPEIPDCG